MICRANITTSKNLRMEFNWNGFEMLAVVLPLVNIRNVLNAKFGKMKNFGFKGKIRENSHFSKKRDFFFKIVALLSLTVISKLPKLAIKLYF